MKIRIIGPSGSGKTYLSQKLSQRLEISAYDLDHILWDNTSAHFDKKRDEVERDAMFQELIEKNSWIIEGVQYSWTGRSFSDADIIYILNPPPFLCRVRIVRRFIKRKLHKTSRQNETLRSLINLLKWTERFYKINFVEIREELEPYRDKIIEIHNKREIQQILKNAKI